MQTSLLGNRYEIRRRIGSGGMAHVYQAFDINLQREVAVKILRESLLTDEAFSTRFLREARAAANLSHPNLVTVHDFGQDQNRYFIVMESVPGSDLKTLLLQENQLAIDRALNIMIQVAAGIGYAHRAGLIHCDLKPHNILITPDQRVKVADFGISRVLASIQPEEHADVVWGSPLYFSPEQADGSPPSPASDVYSLGIIFFEMLAGRLPFESSSAAELAQLHLHAPPPDIRSLRLDVPQALALVLQKTMAKEPSQRYRTADQFGQILRTLSSSASSPLEPEIIPSVERTPAAPASQQVDWISIFLGLAAFIALGGLIPLWLWVCLLYPSCPLSP
ncbi:MAG: serine/threonine protein kinase [Anaerolineales bacterium]|nr:serine/threonine protein kinase [Anaerolineales bacterium]